MIWRLVLFCALAWVASCATLEKASSDPLFMSAFNVQILGKTKMSKPEVVEILVQIILRYDMVMIQEIRDIDGIAFPQLVQEVNDASGGLYDSILSPRSGRTSSKEQYGYIFRADKLYAIEQYEYKDPRDDFERQPYIIEFGRLNPGSQNVFTFIPLHAKPDDAVNEMNELVTVYDESVVRTGIADSIIGGDLNADCSYVCASCWDDVTLRGPPFTWWIPDSADTTVSATDCAYDRIISTGTVTNNVYGASVFLFDQAYGLSNEEAKDVSDHYPVEFYLA